MVDDDPVDYELDGSAAASGREVDAFVDAVIDRDPAPIRSDYADATKTLALTLAANEAIETESPVSLE